MSFQVRSVILAAPNCSMLSSSRLMVAMVPLGAQVGEQVIGAGGEDVAQFGEGDGGDEADGQEEMDPPEDLVGEQERCGCQAHEEELADQQAAGGKVARPGLVRSSVAAIRAPSATNPVIRMANSSACTT